MTRRTTGEDEWDDPWPSEDADDDPTIPCPYCRREIYEDAERCPYCERYISREDAPADMRPWWIIAGLVLCLIVVYFWIVRR